jgi:hypothetical protein
MAEDDVVSIASLEAKSEEIFTLLCKHEVLGNSSARWLETEKAGFKNVVTAQAVGWLGSQPLVLSYPTCVRLIIATHVIDSEASYASIEAVPYPWEHDNIDYAALNRDLQAAISK